MSAISIRNIGRMSDNYLNRSHGLNDEFNYPVGGWKPRPRLSVSGRRILLPVCRHPPTTFTEGTGRDVLRRLKCALHEIPMDSVKEPSVIRDRFCGPHDVVHSALPKHTQQPSSKQVRRDHVTLDTFQRLLSVVVCVEARNTGMLVGKVD